MHKWFQSLFFSFSFKKSEHKFIHSLAVRGINASERSVQPESELLCPIPHVQQCTINPAPLQIITYRPGCPQRGLGSPRSP